VPLYTPISSVLCMTSC